MLLWTKQFETGVEKIDQQHRTLIANINHLEEQLHITNPTKEDCEFIIRLVDFLETYADKHFAQEEECMSRFRCLPAESRPLRSSSTPTPPRLYCCQRVFRRWPCSRPRRGTRTSLGRSEEHTSELQSPCNLVCRLLLEKKQTIRNSTTSYRGHEKNDAAI